MTTAWPPPQQQPQPHPQPYPQPQPATYDHRRAQPLAELRWRTLVPWHTWLDGRTWGGWAPMFLFAALMPFVLLQLDNGGAGLAKLSWGFSLYFAVVWFGALHMLIRPGRVSGMLVAKVVVCTAVLGIALAVALESKLARGDLTLVKAIVGVGYPEEIAKAVAVWVFMYAQSARWPLRQYLFLGAVSGLAFGAAEAVEYSIQYAQALPYLASPDQAVFATVWRLVTDPLFHGCMAGISAFFIGLAARRRDLAFPLVVFGVSTAAVLHGCYDRYAGGWFGTLVAAAIVALFVAYVRTGDAIGDEIDGVTVASPQVEHRPQATPYLQSPVGPAMPPITAQAAPAAPAREDYGFFTAR